MKTCKACHGENPDTAEICEACGAKLDEELEQVTAEEAPAEAEETAAVKAEEEFEEVPAQTGKKLSRGGIIGIVAVVIAVIAAIVIGVTQMNQKQEPEAPAEAPAASEEETAEDPTVTPVSAGHHTNAYGLPSHSIHFAANEDGAYTYSYLNEDGETVTVTQEEVEALLAQEVATSAGMTLTNSQLMYYYDDQKYNFTNMYSSYLSFMMDTTMALDEQLGMDGVNTWEQLFVDSGIQMFHQVAALTAMAEAEGYTLSEEAQLSVDTMEQQLDAAAETYGYADALAYLQAYFGPNADLEDYLDFYGHNVYVNDYLSEVKAGMTASDDELEAYYAENADMLTETYGIQKIDKNVVNIRHILIQPESTTAEDGTTSISDEAWAAAEAEAQRIYDEWQAGEATEETFSVMATEYTTDPGSQSTGGLYEDVYPGQMVAEFNDWCFADGRAVGDHGIVKTSYGYHIMFFSGEGDYVYWKMAVEDMLINDKMNDYISNAMAGQTLTADQNKVVLMNAIAPTVPAAETETEAQ